MNFSSKLMLLVCVVVVNSKVSSTPLEKTERSLDKRSLKNFGAMIKCETKLDKWKLSGYGCWCGYGGAGAPLDGIDRCCYEHDKCYDALIAGDECTTTVDPYVVSYKFSSCSDCALASDYTKWDSLGWVTVACRIEICACDSAAVKCFAQNIYDNSLASYDKSACGEDTNA